MIYQKIRALCTEKGITVSELEKQCGFSTGTIGKWRTFNPVVTRLKAVADYFGVTVDSLLKE